MEELAGVCLLKAIGVSGPEPEGDRALALALGYSGKPEEAIKSPAPFYSPFRSLLLERQIRADETEILGKKQIPKAVFNR